MALWLWPWKESEMNDAESKSVRKGLKRANKAVARMLFRQFGRRGLAIPFRARFDNAEDFEPWNIEIGGYTWECIDYHGSTPEAAVESFRRHGMGLVSVRLMQGERS
jgi:hypothetical protein